LKPLEQDFNIITLYKRIQALKKIVRTFNYNQTKAMVKERLISLDVFRGLTVLMMTIVNNPGDWSIYPPLEHAD
jgi:hypothetical protein